jgi:hypothetical protein
MGIRLGKKIYQSRPGTLMFECPGCGNLHAVYTDTSNVVDGVVNQWTYNGNADAPTFSPSVDVYRDRPELRCHSIITNGRITFCTDSHHALKGQTVDLPDWE